MRKESTSQVFPGNFNGSIDQLLNMVAKADADAVEQEVAKDNALNQIMAEFGVERYEAEVMLEKAHLAMVQQTIDALLTEGLVEVCGTNDEGEPMYRQTSKGKRLAQKTNKQ
jgi:hypothetical protein